MIIDYEKIKMDLSFHMKRGADLQIDLDNNVTGRRKAEDDLLRAVADL
jgi:hypothetical protein